LGEEFLRRFLLHVLPDREKALALCRQVLPGPPARKVSKIDWRQQFESLTGIDPSRCEACGQKALRLVEKLQPARAPRAPPG
jgi:hypothetical protein